MTQSILMVLPKLFPIQACIIIWMFLYVTVSGMLLGDGVLLWNPTIIDNRIRKSLPGCKSPLSHVEHLHKTHNIRPMKSPLIRMD